MVILIADCRIVCSFIGLQGKFKLPWNFLSGLFHILSVT